MGIKHLRAMPLFDRLARLSVAAGLLGALAVALALGAAPAAGAEAPVPPGDPSGESQLLSSIPGQPGEGGRPVASEAAQNPGGAEPQEEEELAQEPPGSEQPAGSALAAQITQSDAGHAKYRIDAATYFDEYAGDGEWIKAHVDVIKAYPTFGDIYVQYGKPVIGYHDPATEGFAPLN